MRRSHHALKNPDVITEKKTGEYTLPHHISANGYYRGRKILTINAKKK